MTVRAVTQKTGPFPPRRLPPFLVALLAALLLAPFPARALDWRTLDQPVGAFVGNAANPDGVYAPATINTILGGIPPFDPGTDVTLIRLTRTQQYVRFYNPTDPVNPSGAVGSWMMRAGEVRGLTSAQIRDKFALPAMPTSIVQVIVPANYALYTGIAAPIAGWGDGGGLQNRAMANRPPAGIANDPWLPASSYVNAQPLAATPVLSYGFAASGERGAGMGAYMDSLAPRVGSDLEGIYDSLDTMLFTGGQADVAQAMDQFSPARFDALNRIFQRAISLQQAAIDVRADELDQGLADGDAGAPVLLAAAGGLEQLAGVLPRLGRRRADAGDWGLWLRGTGEYMRDDARKATPYSAVTAALHAGADRRLGREFVLGFGVGYARTRLDWDQDGGDCDTDTVSLTLYGLWRRAQWFVNADLGLNAAFTSARRHIRSAVADRTARSDQTGGGAGVRIRAGKRVPVGEDGWTLTPSVELGYSLHRQNSFTENGAGDLDLHVRTATSQTVRTGADLALANHLDLGNGAALVPEAALGWRRDTPLDDRGIQASFSGYSQGFTSYGDDSPADELLLRAGVIHRDAAGLTRFLRYSGTLSDHFQAHGLEAGCRWEF